MLKLIKNPAYKHQTLSYFSHLLVVVVSEVQLVSGLCQLCLPRVDIIWICELGKLGVTATKHSAKIIKLNLQ